MISKVNGETEIFLQLTDILRGVATKPYNLNKMLEVLAQVMEKG